MKLKYNTIETRSLKRRKKTEYLHESLIDNHKQELVDYATNAERFEQRKETKNATVSKLVRRLRALCLDFTETKKKKLDSI
jgi:hypothetical protein